jgi:hypothetical protein
MKLLAFIIWLLALPAFGANHYVLLTASGANTGADWTNAFTSIPTGAGLTRGDIYYLGTGNYGIYTFNTTESGASVITFRAATIADHGTATGWSNSFATDSSPALFKGSPNVVFEVDRNYLTLDGNGTNTLDGCQKSICGIKISNASNTGLLWGLNAPSIIGLTLKYVELAGVGDVCTSSCEETLRIIGTSGSHGSSVTLQHLYMHDSDSNFIQTQYLDTVLAEQSFFDNNGTSGGSNHCTGWADSNSTAVTIRYNVFRDIEGTAMIEPGVNGGTISNWGVYGNLFYFQSGNPRGKHPIEDGVFAVTNSNATNVTFSNNTIVNVSASGSPNISGIYLYAAGTFSGILVENNLWYNDSPATHVVPGSGFTFDYNTYLNTTETNDAGSHSFTNGSASDPFVAWTSGNFALSSEVVDAHLSDGVSQSSPYNLDPTGATRGADSTWDRGAYEFVLGAGGLAPAPPVGLFATVSRARFRSVKSFPRTHRGAAGPTG